ncbi:hypothetical protein ABIB00_007997 [Bradyrhizobium sp. LB14.3]|uniref:hypothetical protein n=1 Tax=Bradyrhizobium sp. LB14.3 TaxID=3156328 RepID=UPI003399D25F
MERSLLIGMTRDKYVERWKQQAFDHLDRADLKNSVASFVGEYERAFGLRVAKLLGKVWRFASDGEH